MTRTISLAAVLLLTACGGSSGGGTTGSASLSTTGDAAAQTATIGMNDKLQFDPNTLQAKVGTVAFDVKNLGRVPHNLHFDDAALGRTGTISGGESETLKVTFAKAGTFTFVCTFHSGMDGKVIVS